jgi:hypothetical protein
MPQATFLFTLKSPMRFSVSIPGCPGPSTYSTFGILRFTVLSRLGRRESYQGTKGPSTNKKIHKPGKRLGLDRRLKCALKGARTIGAPSTVKETRNA